SGYRISGAEAASAAAINRQPAIGRPIRASTDVTGAETMSPPGRTSNPRRAGNRMAFLVPRGSHAHDARRWIARLSLAGLCAVGAAAAASGAAYASPGVALGDDI